mmetsp:Transcript_172711/g.553574  ORF Transcript_172711/g.553574 Transcript_172711/m.553574 type:complete len:289 (-) Transcript_172711:1097-1963(-)
MQLLLAQHRQNPVRLLLLLSPRHHRRQCQVHLVASPGPRHPAAHRGRGGRGLRAHYEHEALRYFLGLGALPGPRREDLAGVLRGVCQAHGVRLLRALAQGCAARERRGDEAGVDQRLQALQGPLRALRGRPRQRWLQEHALQDDEGENRRQGARGGMLDDQRLVHRRGAHDHDARGDEVGDGRPARPVADLLARLRGKGRTGGEAEGDPGEAVERRAHELVPEDWDGPLDLFHRGRCLRGWCRRRRGRPHRVARVRCRPRQHGLGGDLPALPSLSGLAWQDRRGVARP